MLGMLAVVVVVWVAVLDTRDQRSPGTQARQETKAGPKGQKETADDGQAKTRRALEEDAAAQEGFRLPDEEGVQGAAARDDGETRTDGEGGGEGSSAAMTPNAEVASIVEAETCSGASIELYAGEKQMLDLHNRTRAERRLSRLCLHPALVKVARDHSQDMLGRDYFSHYSPEGSKPTERAKKAGYASCGKTSTCGENLAVGPSYPSTPDRLFEGLMNSPGHKANILREEFSEVGVGLRVGSYKGYDGSASMYSVEFAGQP